ncbi:MAG: DUF2723 domain-containing protein, partial [Geobacteraceae bacterium]
LLGMLSSIRFLYRKIYAFLEANPFLGSLFVAFGTLLLYYRTLVREVGWGDSAELALSAYQLGLTHPPGYPLYTLLGKLVSLFFDDPAVGTNLLSAVCTSLAIGVMSLVIHQVTRSPLIAIFAPVLFAVLPNIWDMAVVAEVYNVNIFFLGCSIYFFIRVERSQFTTFLPSSALFFGLSLGTYQANLLLLPAFLLALLIGTPRHKLVKNLFVFGSIVSLIWLAFLSYTILRSYAPVAVGGPLDSVDKILVYVSGSELRPGFPADIHFYTDRLEAHTSLFSKNFLYLAVPVGLLGALTLFKSRRNTAIFLAAAFLINFLFFSFYAVSDYFTMPTPSYYIFSIWIGCGLAFLSRIQPVNEKKLELASVVFCIALVMLQVRGQLSARVERSNTFPVTELVLFALDEFPEDAIVISRWERYAPMLYFQQVYKVREDVTLVVSNEFLDQINEYSLRFPDRALLIDNKSDVLVEEYTIKRYFRRWFLIVAPNEQ